MFESWVSRRKNLNLREALLLRKAERYTEAWIKLEAACAENDGEAFYFKAHALWNGGWGQKYNVNYKQFLKKAWEAGCWWPDFYNLRNTADHALLLTDPGNPFVHEFCIHGMYCCDDHKLYAATSGDGSAQYGFAKCGDGWYLKSANQNCSHAIGHMSHCSLCGDVLTRAKFKIKYGYAKGFRDRICNMYVYDCTDEGMRLQELYMYGKEFASGNTFNLSPEDREIAYQVYYRSWLAAQKTVLFWLLWTKRKDCFVLTFDV
jgi:hypothetical protein